LKREEKKTLSGAENPDESESAPSGVSLRASHEDVVGEALRVEVPGLLSDGTAA